MTQFFGASLSELVARYDSDLNDEINNQMNLVYGNVKDIEDPFDYAIDNDSYRPAVLESVNSLRDLGDLFSEAGSKLGLTINVD